MSISKFKDVTPFFRFAVAGKGDNNCANSAHRKNKFGNFTLHMFILLK